MRRLLFLAAAVLALAAGNAQAATLSMHDAAQAARAWGASDDPSRVQIDGCQRLSAAQVDCVILEVGEQLGVPSLGLSLVADVPWACAITLLPARPETPWQHTRRVRVAQLSTGLYSEVFVLG